MTTIEVLIHNSGGSSSAHRKVPHPLASPKRIPAKIDTEPSLLSRQLGELFFFDYGVIVFWGLTEPQEMYLLSLLKPFEQEKLDPEDVETEDFRYQYRPFSQARIFNDVITLRYADVCTA